MLFNYTCIKCTIYIEVHMLATFILHAILQLLYFNIDRHNHHNCVLTQCRNIKLFYKNSNKRSNNCTLKTVKSTFPIILISRSCSRSYSTSSVDISKHVERLWSILIRALSHCNKISINRKVPSEQQSCLINQWYDSPKRPTLVLPPPCNGAFIHRNDLIK